LEKEMRSCKEELRDVWMKGKNKMVLKSTFNKLGKGKSPKRTKSKPIKDIVTGGVTALLGVALLSETANVVKAI